MKRFLTLAILATLCASCGSYDIQRVTELGQIAGLVFSESERDPETLLESAEILTFAAEALDNPDNSATTALLGLLSNPNLDLDDTEKAILIGWSIAAQAEILTPADREALSAFLNHTANTMLDQYQVRTAESNAADGRIRSQTAATRARLKALDIE